MSTQHEGEYCSMKDKMCLDKGTARDEAARRSMTAYHCNECGKWHLCRRLTTKNRRRMRNQSKR